MLVLQLLPVFLTSNIHCYGMCGPLMLLLAKQRKNHLYLIGRIVSYSLVGMACSLIGKIPIKIATDFSLLRITHWILILWVVFKLYRLLLSTIIKKPKKISHWKKAIIQKLSPISRLLVSMSVEKSGRALFFMGCMSVMIPCGQTLFVFSLCALHGDMMQGWLAGFLLAVVSTPALAFNLKIFQSSSIRGNRYMDELAQILSLVLAMWLTA